jgi:PEP-CTERM motif
MTKRAKALIMVMSVTILLLVLVGLPVSIPMGGSAISLVPNAQASQVPEPSTLAVLGLVGLYFVRRRRNNRSKND